LTLQLCDASIGSLQLVETKLAIGGSLMKHRVLAPLVAAAALFATSAVAQNQTELIMCNNTGQNIQIAVAYMDAQTGRWTLSAWHNRGAGQCGSFGAIRTGLFYYHAKNERGAVWPNRNNTDRNYCVPSSAVRRDMTSGCGMGELSRPFRGRTVNPGRYTFSFS
jgi:uncharacterized membrane protein